MQQLISIQALRALAALMVVFQHAQDDGALAAAMAGAAFERYFLIPWGAGVDLFFVISGFVMIYASEKVFAQKGSARAFLVQRLARIVPLYWLATVFFTLFVLRGAAVGKVSAPSVSEFLTSMAFLPWPRGLDGAPRPILSLGWTLEYEMFFYLVLAVFVFLPRNKAVSAATGFLLAIVTLSTLYPPQNIALSYWSDPIILEFVLGMIIAVIYLSGVRILPAMAGGAIVLAIACLVLDPMNSAQEDIGAVTANGFLRLFSWGGPMAVILASIILCRDKPQPAKPHSPFLRAMARIGDASYSLYLFHPLALIILRKVWLALGLQGTFGYWPLVALDVAVASALSLAIHARIEIPLTRMARKILKPRPKAGAVSVHHS